MMTTAMLDPAEMVAREGDMVTTAIVAERYGGADVLERREVDVPAPGAGEVLVEVHATSLNPVDWYLVSGPWFARVGAGLRAPKDPRCGLDLSGRVIALGADIDGLAVGDEVFGTGQGAWAERALSLGSKLAVKPQSVSFEDAAAVPIAGLTALQALRDHAKVQPGERVLVNGGSGGVGTYTVQLAVWLGAEVTAVCSTPNVELVRSLGAAEVVDYRVEDVTRRPDRFDAVIDIAGSRSLRELRRVLTPHARVVVVGAKMSAQGLGPLGHIVGMRLAAIGRGQTSTWFVAKTNRADLEVLGGLLADGAVRSVIDRRYAGLTAVPDAFRYLSDGHARGKLVVTV